MLDESESRGRERKSVITDDIIKGEILTDENLALKLTDLGPFLSRQVAERLKKSLKTKNVVSPEVVKQITQPPSIKVGTLRDYQLRGVSWLVDRYDKGINCILADEMGLGKTFQTIAFFSYLRDVRKLPGPHLVVVPLSVLFNWMSECKKFCPSLRLMRLHTNSAKERVLMSKKLGQYDFDVCVTTYEMIKTTGTKSALSRMHWRSIVLDEGHRIKNDETQITRACNLLKSRFKIILTGTPIQNNLGEMYCLLNYLNPRIFDNKEVFDDCFSLDAQNIVVDRKTLADAHYMLRAFILRRLKTEVEVTLPSKLETLLRCPMSEMQKFWTLQLLSNDAKLLDRINGNESAYKARGDDWKKLQSLLAQLRKAANHPYLFPGAESNTEDDCTEEIVTASGKMVVLDRLLTKLKAKGHRVVIFSQYTRTLDILNDYLDMRGYNHVRFDGSTNRVWREVLITQFNLPASPTFVFCLSTRAGGEGVNLYTADTVILFDSDWNPQVDIQAMARVHRIGQTKPVHIYRLVTAGTVEERIVQRAQKKLFLDSMVNRGSTANAEALDAENGRTDTGPEDEDIDQGTTLSALKFGFNACFGGSGSNPPEITDEDLEAILDRTRGDKKPKGMYDSSSSDDDDDDVEGDEGDLENGLVEVDEVKLEASMRAGTSQSAVKVAGSKKKRGGLEEGQQCSVKDFKETAPLLSLRMFEGEMVHKKSKRSSFGDISREWVLQGKREKVSRFTQQHVSNVGMVNILKSNMYSLEEGEPSVFEKETTSRALTAAANGVKPRRNVQVAGVDYDHQDYCQVCWDGGDLICCDYCPSSYHAQCLGLDKDTVPAMWSCPHHKLCVGCEKTAYAVGFLFRCAMCPNAHCEDCRSGEQEILGSHPTWPDYRTTGNTCYVLCSKSCSDFSAAQEEARKAFEEQQIEKMHKEAIEID